MIILKIIYKLSQIIRGGFSWCGKGKYEVVKFICKFKQRARGP